MAPNRFLCTLAVFAIPLLVSAQDDKFEELQSERTRQLAVHYLDGYLGLSLSQHLEFEALLKRDWNHSVNQSAQVMLWAGFRSASGVFGKLQESDLEKILSEDQLNQFESLTEHALNQSQQLDYLRGSTEHTSDPIVPTLKMAVTLETNRLKELLELDADQIRILKVAAKGVTTRVLSERQQFQEMFSNGQVNMGRGFEWVEVAVEGPVFRLRKSSIWNSSLKRILTERQFDLFQQDQRKQWKTSSMVSTHSLALSYFSKKEMTLDEYRDFTTLIEDAITQARQTGELINNGSMVFDVITILIRLEEDKLQKTLSQDNWDTIEPILTRLRTQLGEEPQEGQRADR